MKNYLRLRLLRFIIPGTFLIYSLFFISAYNSYFHAYESQLIKKETDFATIEFQKNLTDLILKKAEFLTSIAELSDRIIPGKNTLGDEPRFHEAAESIIKNIDGFSAITYLNRDGYIVWKSPKELTTESVGKKPQQNWKYMEDAKKTKQPQLTHIIQTYEGYDAFVIYAPIFHKNEFSGWLSGVFNYKEYFDKFFGDRKIENLYIEISWVDYPQKSYSFGNRIGHNLDLDLQFQILNQEMSVKIDLRKHCLIADKRKYHDLLVIFSYVISFMVAFFMYKQIKSHQKLSIANKKLKRDKTLLNILSHDLAAPLTLITENAMRLKERSIESTEIARILKAANRLKDLISRVRSFHATNLGRIKLYLEPCSPKDLINESLSLFEDQIKNKNIQCSIHVPDVISDCIADRVIAIHNVIGNVLSNAIKFTEAGGAIKIDVRDENKYVVINIQDKGIGIPKEILSDLFDETQAASTIGTIGEMGTGLGMLQIKSFMDYFNGHLKIETDPKGTKVSLYFRKT